MTRRLAAALAVPLALGIGLAPRAAAQDRAPVPRLERRVTDLTGTLTAGEIAAIEQKLAACVSVLSPCRSVYRWKGALQRDEEHPLLIKTTAERYPALEQALRAAHPYELPEIIAVSVERGLPAYLEWVAAETTT